MKKIDLGVSADRSMSTVFEPLIAAAARAQRAYAQVEAMSAKAAAKEVADADRAAQARIRADMRAFDAKLKASQQAAAATAKAAAAEARATAQMENAILRAADKEMAAAQKAADAKIRADKRAADAAIREIERRIEAEKRAADAQQREHMRATQFVGRIKDRYFADQQRAEERDAARSAAAAAREASQTGRSRFGVAREAYETLGGVARRGIGIGSEMLSGAGVNLDLGSAVSRSVSLESTAARATSSAATAQGRVAKPEEIKETIDAVRKAGLDTALDFNKLASGLEDFVSKSSDLETGKKILGELGATARATGTDVDKLISAAGDVNKTLEDSPDKAERLLSIMRLVAKQGALGNVEVKDLALYMGKLTASAFMYEGSRDTNIGTLGALAQISMRGGATTAAEGTRAAGAFARDITKGAAAKRFDEAGIELYADEGKTKLRDPEKIITDFYKKSGGSLADLAKLFQNEMAKKVILGFGTVAEDAKKQGRDPVEAIHAEFAKFRATITKEDVAAAATLSKGTTEAKAQDFQNKLDMIAASLADRVLPAMERLAPKAIQVADALSKIITTAMDNPVTAITAAIVGSIAKAMIGDAIKDTLTSILKGAGGGVGGAVGNAAGAAGGGAGGLGRTVATAGIMAGVVLMADQVEQTRKEGEELGEAEFGGGSFGGKAGGLSRGAALARKRRGTATKAEGTGGGISSLGETLAAAFAAQQSAASATASSGTSGGAAAPQQVPNPVPPLEAILSASRTTNELLGRIAAQGVGGPSAGSGTSNTGAPAVSGRR